jgi:hypothetical protein
MFVTVPVKNVLCVSCYVWQHNPQTVLFLVCYLTDIVETQYVAELHKPYGGELIQMASAHMEDVNVTELGCRPLCVILSCCHDGLPASLKKVVQGSKPATFQLCLCTELCDTSSVFQSEICAFYI